jgi:ATP adenylyltransferase
MNNEEILDMHKLMVNTKSALSKILKPSGFNIGFNIGDFSGAGIKDHLHMHVVPRWPGDTNFMTTIGSTKVISQSLNSLHKELKKTFKNLNESNKKYLPKTAKKKDIGPL